MLMLTRKIKKIFNAFLNLQNGRVIKFKKKMLQNIVKITDVSFM